MKTLQSLLQNPLLAHLVQVPTKQCLSSVPVAVATSTRLEVAFGIVESSSITTPNKVVRKSVKEAVRLFRALVRAGLKILAMRVHKEITKEIFGRTSFDAMEVTVPRGPVPEAESRQEILLRLLRVSGETQEPVKVISTILIQVSIDRRLGTADRRLHPRVRIGRLPDRIGARLLQAIRLPVQSIELTWSSESAVRANFGR